MDQQVFNFFTRIWYQFRFQSWVVLNVSYFQFFDRFSTSALLNGGILFTPCVETSLFASLLLL